MVQSGDESVGKLAVSFLELNRIRDSVDPFDFDTPALSLFDILSENVGDLGHFPGKFQHCLEQFEVFSPSDVADFISVLACEGTQIGRALNGDRSNLGPFLRPFRSVKATIDQLILAFDREAIPFRSNSSFQLLLSCLKEISNLRTIPIGPFLGRWRFPLTQAAFLSHILASSPLLGPFPKSIQLPKASPVVIGDFRADHWRCPELIDTLIYLYDFAREGVLELLRDCVAKGPALLLLVHAQTGPASRFGAHLLRMLLCCPSQYLAGVSALWSANPTFFMALLRLLYEDQRSQLGKILDVIDDLGIFGEF
jgi:hypothetical protein